MLNKEETLLVIIDVQGKLAQVVHDSKTLMENLVKIIQGIQIFNIPIVWVEQYPEGLGSTVWEVSKNLEGLKPISKITFNACENKKFVTTVKETGRQQILVVGIETHVCVYQTAVGLKKLGYEVQVVMDAVASRTLSNKEVGLDKMKSVGIERTSVETALFELMDIAEGKQFKQVIKLLK